MAGWLVTLARWLIVCSCLHVAASPLLACLLTACLSTCMYTATPETSKQTPASRQAAQLTAIAEQQATQHSAPVIRQQGGGGGLRPRRMRLSTQPATHSLSPINQSQPAASRQHSRISMRRQQPNQQTKPQRGPRAAQPSAQSGKATRFTTRGYIT